MSETAATVPAATDAQALRDLLEDGADVAVRFDGCPVPGALHGVLADGTLDVEVGQEHPRYAGAYRVRPVDVTAVELDG